MMSTGDILHLARKNTKMLSNHFPGKIVALRLNIFEANLAVQISISFVVVAEDYILLNVYKIRIRKLHYLLF